LNDRDAAWAALFKAAQAARERRIEGLFAAEPDRVARLGLSAAGLEIDLSKQPWSMHDLKVMVDLARASGLEAARAKLFAGGVVNASEGRPALHMALRAPDGADYRAEGKAVSRDVEATRGAMRGFCEAVRAGAKAGCTGKPFRSIVHIGIGGSDLGPAMMAQALTPYTHDGPRAHFVSNVDGAHLADTLRSLHPATTLFTIASKTFTTQETMTNARSAREWFLARAKDEAAIA